MENKRGISLIVLVITIIVMVIIAGIVIVNLQEKDSIYEADKAAFQMEVVKAQEALVVNLRMKEMKDNNFDRTTVNANTEMEMKKYIKNPSQNIIEYFVIQKGELVLKKELQNDTFDDLVVWTKELNIKVGE